MGGSHIENTPPKRVRQDVEKRILEFFNGIESVDEIVFADVENVGGALHICGDACNGCAKTRVDTMTAMIILASRKMLGGRFRSFRELCDVSHVEPEKLASILDFFEGSEQRK